MVNEGLKVPRELYINKDMEKKIKEDLEKAPARGLVTHKKVEPVTKAQRK